MFCPPKSEGCLHRHAFAVRRLRPCALVGWRQSWGRQLKDLERAREIRAEFQAIWLATSCHASHQSCDSRWARTKLSVNVLPRNVRDVNVSRKTCSKDDKLTEANCILSRWKQRLVSWKRPLTFCPKGHLSKRRTTMWVTLRFPRTSQ